MKLKKNQYKVQLGKELEFFFNFL